MTKPFTLRPVSIVLFAVVLPILAACGGTPHGEAQPDVDATPSATLKVTSEWTTEPTQTPTQTAATATVPPTATPSVGPEGNCQEYLDLKARLGESTQRTVVTTYRCRNTWIDSTGQAPSLAPEATVGTGTPIQFELATGQPPRSIKVRLYPGAGISASFLRWPEELPTGIEPVDTLEPGPGLRFEYVPQAAPGEYSLVLRIEWEDEVEVFYATSFAVEGGETLLPTEETVLWTAHSSPVFQVSLQYPAHWQPVPGEEGRKYAAPDGGYFILDAIGLDGTEAPQVPIDEIAAGQAGHKLLPYGSQPRIEPLQVADQEARLILPAADASMGNQAMLIVRYPQPVDIAGTAYTFFALYADEEHIRAIAQSLRFEGAALPTETPTRAASSDDSTERPRIDSFQVTPTQAEPGDTVTLTWAASGARATLCPSTRYVLFTNDDCRSVDLAGTTTFALPLDLAGNGWIGFILSVEGKDGAAPEVGQASVAIQCSTTWFYSDEPQAGVCPRAPNRISAAMQRFEHGTMIWLEQRGQYLVLHETPLVEGDARKRLDRLQDPLQVVRDTSAARRPPEGRYAPESGFGLVWRGDVQGSPGYVEALGWALAPEVAYEGLYQCDDAPPSGGMSWQTCVLQGAEEEVYVFHPLGGWYALGERSP